MDEDYEDDDDNDTPCHSCGAQVGELHFPMCRYEQCAQCGRDLVSLEHPCLADGYPRNRDRMPWQGKSPGWECDEYNWYARPARNDGRWIRCSPNAPGAEPDHKRLYRSAKWDRKLGRWVKRTVERFGEENGNGQEDSKDKE